MAARNLRDLERFLTEHGVEMEDRAFELELNCHGWSVTRERTTRRGIQNGQGRDAAGNDTGDRILERGREALT